MGVFRNPRTGRLILFVSALILLGVFWTVVWRGMDRSAMARGADIYAELVGFGHVNDSAHIANPQEKAMSASIQAALADADLAAKDIDYVNAHATGTIQGVITEAHAINSVLGPDIPVSSCKGHIGHTLGAAGSLESILALEMIRKQELIPTLNLKTPDPECNCVDLVMEKSLCRGDPGERWRRPYLSTGATGCMRDSPPRP